MPSSPREPLLILPGFAPDAISFAFRTTLSLLIAYLFSFYIQLDSASTAGVCVAIVAQPSSGQALSKAAYRLLGTVLGGVVALFLTAIFGQDRTMLLVVFALWLGLCTAAASLLRDFRAYAAVLCGYTVGIISITDIDAPQSVFASAVNRVAAIVVGIVAVALVNAVFAPGGAWRGLCGRLRAVVETMTRQAARSLRGEAALDSEASLALAGELLLLRTEASYAAAELPDGGLRADGARSAIAALFGMLSAARAIEAALRWQPPEAPARLGLVERADALDQGAPPKPAPPLEALATLHDAFITDRLDDLLAPHRLANSGLDTLVSGAPLARRVHLRVYHDWVGAGLNATRAMLGMGLGALFCIYSGWSGSTVMLVQLAAFVALLGLAPNPTKAAWGAMLAFPLPVLLAGLVKFLALPLVAGPVPFCIAIGSCCFALSLLVRLPAAAAISTTLLLFFCLVLAPSNPQDYDLSSFLNLVAAQFMAVLFVMLAFWLILPVQPNRRLFRVADAIGRELKRRLGPAPRRQHDQAEMQSLHYDRLAAAALWLGRRTLSRRRLLARLQALSEIDAALWRAETGLDAAARVPALRLPVARARRSLDQPERGEMEAAAAALLEAGLAVEPQPAELQPMLLHAVSGLYGAAQMLEAERPVLRKSGILRAGSARSGAPDPKVPEPAGVA